MYKFGIACDEIDKEYTQLIYTLEKDLRDDWDIRNKIVIMDAYVNLEELFSWFIENEESILQEELPDSVEKKAKGNLSIQEKLYIYFDNYDEEDELPPCDEDEIIDGYQRRHCVCFGANGTDIRYAYIGMNNGVLEFSYAGEFEKWQFPVDLNDFFAHIKIMSRPTVVLSNRSHPSTPPQINS